MAPALRFSSMLAVVWVAFTRFTSGRVGCGADYEDMMIRVNESKSITFMLNNTLDTGSLQGICLYLVNETSECNETLDRFLCWNNNTNTSTTACAEGNNLPPKWCEEYIKEPKTTKDADGSLTFSFTILSHAVEEIVSKKLVIKAEFFGTVEYQAVKLLHFVFTDGPPKPVPTQQSSVPSSQSSKDPTTQEPTLDSFEKPFQKPSILGKVLGGVLGGLGGLICLGLITYAIYRKRKTLCHCLDTPGRMEMGELNEGHPGIMDIPE